MIKSADLHNKPYKLVEIYGKSRTSWKDAFFTDEARFHGKCHGHEIANYNVIRLVPDVSSAHFPVPRWFVLSEYVYCLQLEKTNQTRVYRLVDHVVAHKLTDSFQLFCDALVGRYKWLVRDLHADLKVERGEVKPLPETLQESAAVVHRSQFVVVILDFNAVWVRLLVRPGLLNDHINQRSVQLVLKRLKYPWHWILWVLCMAHLPIILNYA